MKLDMNRNSDERKRSYIISHKKAGKKTIPFTIGKGQYTTLLLSLFLIKSIDTIDEYPSKEP